LKDHVDEAEVDVCVVESGLVITTSAEVQKTIAGMVSLITGEAISLDLGDLAPAVYQSGVGPVWRPGMLQGYSRTPYTPTNMSETPAAYNSPPAYARRRTVYERDPQTGSMVPRTVFEGAPTSEETDVPATQEPQPTKP
jgi:hypothetical protein